MLDITNVIDVSVNETPRGLNDYQVNNVALFTEDQFLVNPDSDTFRAYVDSSSVGTDFGTNTETYSQAVAFFSQQPNPLNGDGELIIVPVNTDVSGQIDEVAIYTPGAGYSVDDVLTVTGGGGTEGTLKVLTVSHLGAVLAVEVLTVGSGYSTGTNLATSVAPSGGTNFTLDIVSVSNSETLLQAIERIQSEVFFVGIISTFYPIAADIADVADDIQAMGNKILMWPTSTYADIAGACTTIKNDSNDKTRCLYHATSALEARLMAAAYVSVLASPNFSAANSTLTMNLKELKTISPDLTINQTIADAADAAGVDIYPSIAGLGKTQSSSANNDADVVMGIVWMVSRLQVNGFNALAQTNTKVPQTEPGVSVLKTAYRQVCEEAVNNAFVAPGTWTSPDTFGNQLDFIENIQNVGYYIYSQPVSEQSSTDRAAHKAPIIQIAVKLAGWIKNSHVILNVNP